MAGLPKAEGCQLESIKATGSCNDQNMYTGLFLTPFVFAFAFLSFLQNSTELVRNDWVPQTVKCCTVLKCLDKGFSMCITANSSKITESRVQHAVNICRYHWMTTTVALGIEGSLLVYFAFCPPLFGDNAQITSGKHVPTAPKDNFRLHPFCVRSWRAALLKLKVFSLMGVSLSGTPSHHGFQYVSILKWSMTWMIWGYPRDLIHLDTIHLQPSRWVPITQAMAAVAQCCPERKRTMRCVVPGEAQEVIEARKTSFVPGKKSAPGSRREDRAGSEVCHELVACWKLVLDIVLDIVSGLCTRIPLGCGWKMESPMTCNLQVF